MSNVVALKTRRLPCWIESFTEALSGVPSPEIFRKWSAIATIGGALERRVYTQTAQSRLYSNMFVLLVAPPGVGKSQAIDRIGEMLRANGKLRVAPDDITKAALLDALKEAHQSRVFSPTEMLDYHSLQIIAGEFGVLCPAHDLGFLNVLNVLYDNRSLYKETRRGREEPLIIENPQINLLSGTQPDYLASFLPEEAWGQGFMSRVIMVYHGSAIHVPLFGKNNKADLRTLASDLSDIADLHGEITWTPEAQEEVERQHRSGFKPIPNHLKLKHYLPRRVLHILKLSMISSVSRSNSLLIEREDVLRAIEWLVEAEGRMPDIFKDMSGKNDRDLMVGLHAFAFQLYVRNEKRPVAEARLLGYLSERTPPYNVKHLFDLCFRTGILVKGQIPGTVIPGTVNTGPDELPLA